MVCFGLFDPFAISLAALMPRSGASPFITLNFFNSLALRCVSKHGRPAVAASSFETRARKSDLSDCTRHARSSG
jgi:hypothetical protein